MPKFCLRLCCVVIVSMWLAGCASHPYKEAAVNQALQARNCTQALKELEAVWLTSEGKLKNKKDALLYYLDRGVILRELNRFDESNTFFEKAEDRVDKLFAKSVTRETASWLVNDLTVEYGGEDFERVMVNYYMAMNYLDLGKLEDALVEFRKIDLKLRDFNSKYKEHKNVYKEDAFARYLAGVGYEAVQQINDAFISYRKSLDTYREDYRQYYGVSYYPQLPADLLRTADALGFTEELNTYQNQFPGTNWQSQETYRQQGELIVVFEYGLAPYKQEKSAVFPGPNGPVKLVLPGFVRRGSRLSHANVIIDGQRLGETVETQNLTEIAIKNLADREARVVGKMIARVAAKQVAAHQVKKEWGATAGWLASTLGSLSEVADTRSWLTLPHAIGLERILLEPGQYNVALDLMSGGMFIQRIEIGSLELRAGEKTFVCYRSFR